MSASNRFEFRPYQSEAITRVLTDWQESSEEPKKRSVLVSIPTGGGKTHVAAGVIQKSFYPELAKDKGRNKVLVLVHRDELLHQAVKTIKVHFNDVSIGIVNPEKKELHCDIIVAMVPTLVRQLDMLREHCEEHGGIKWVITDEAHHAYANQWRDIYMAISESMQGKWYHLGITATPMRLKSSEQLSDVFPHVSFAMSIFDLIAQGYLVSFRGISIVTEHLESLIDDLPKDKESDLTDDQVEKKLADNLPFMMTVVSAYKKHADGRKAVVFCAGRFQAENMARLFRQMHIPCAHVDGKMSVKKRREILKDFSDGKFKVLCNVNVLTEGFDEPSVDAVLLARPTRSLGLYIQMLGRGLRLYEGKKDCIVIDFCGVTENEDLSFRKLADVLEFYGMTQAAKMAKGNAKKERKQTGKKDGKDKSQNTIEVSPDTIEIYEEIEEALKNDPGVSEAIEYFSQGLVSSSIKDAESLQGFPWFIHTGIESCEFRPGYNILMIPTPLEDKEEIARRLKFLKLMVFVVAHSEDGEKWFCRLTKRPISRAAARITANMFIHYFGDKDKQDPKADWRMNDITPEILMRGYTIENRLVKSFPVRIPFRARAVNMGVATDIINAMESIEVLENDDKEIQREDMQKVFSHILMKEMHIEKDSIRPVDEEGIEFDLKDDNEKMIIRKAFWIARQQNDPDINGYLNRVSVKKNKVNAFVFERIADNGDVPLARRSLAKVEIVLSKSINIMVPGTNIEVHDNEELVHEYAKKLAERNKKAAREVMIKMLE